MKKYEVTVLITSTVVIENVEAESEKQAETIAENWTSDDYMGYIKQAGWHRSEAIDATEVKTNKQQ